MHTVSTLCATSTVGIAACGFALALPHYTTNDHLPNLPVNFNTNTPPLLEEPLDGSPNEAKFAQFTPTSACIPPPLSRPSTSRRWLRRLSESFSSSPTSSLSLSSPSSTVSSTSSRTRSWTTSQPSSRPPTRNKLVKRSPTERLSRANSPVPPPRQHHKRRPSTAIYQPPICEQSNHSPPFQVSRPSTSGLESSHLCPPDLESVDVWRPFFPSKRQSITHQSVSGPTKLAKKAPVIRRIVPDLFRRRHGPALVIAPAINSYPADRETNDDDTNSLLSDTASLNQESRPASHHMGETQHQRSTRHRSSTAPIPTKTRKFSLSNFLGAASSKTTPKETTINDDAITNSNGFVGMVSMGGSFARRHSTSEARPTPYHSHRNNRPSTSVYDGLRREPLPPIQSLSLLDLDSTQDPASSESMSNFGAQPEEHPIEACLGAPALCFAARRHRLSIMSASERASTLIGSESEHDFGSDTLFDSMRTRISEMTPMRADRIFDLDRCHLDIRSPLQSSFDDIPIISHTTPTHRGIDRMCSSPNSTHTAQQHMGVASITLDDEEDGWSSDWDIPSKSADEDDHRLPGQGGLRPYGGLFTGSRMGLGLQSNGSNTSFGTAREGFSVDGSSMRETNSILDWNDGVSIHTSNSHGSGYRPKTVHAKESMLSSTRTGRRAPTYHVRSQSVPVVNTLRGRTPLPSENWDDDFLDDDGEFGMSKSDITMVIPRAIEERQASIIGHLGCVREFALLVEDLKRLRDTAIAKGIRHKVDSDLWDEADGIIALATLDDDEEDAPLKKDKLHRQNTWSPQQRRREQQNQRIMDENSAYTTASSRHSVLSPDDDIFGGNDGNLPSTPRGGRRLSPVSSISPMSRKIVDKNDPIEVAKSMMEKMQHRQRSVDSLRRGGYDGKVHFDTDMLRNLVVQTGNLKQKLARSVEGYPPSPEKGLRLKIRTMEPPADDKFDFDLSPIKSSLDEDMRALDRVNPNGLEYTPVIGVA